MNDRRRRSAPEWMYWHPVRVMATLVILGVMFVVGGFVAAVVAGIFGG